jgi:hypothetical protein
VSVRETLADWRHDGGLVRWAASIIAQFLVEGGLAALLGYVTLLAFQWVIGLDILYLFTPAEIRVVAWLTLTAIIAQQWTIGEFIPDR